MSSSLSLSIDVPWTLVAVSPDMMDTEHCNKKYPPRWRSSLAIYAYEPSLDDIPEGMCDVRLTYLKVAASITGYQPTDAEPEAGYTEFRDVSSEIIEDILDEYYACYGVMLNGAVHPYGDKKTEPRRP